MIPMQKIKKWITWIRHAAFALFVTSLAMPAFAHDLDSPLPHNPECTIQSFLGRAHDIEKEVYDQLAPDGVLTIGVNYGNPNHAQLDPSGQLHGTAIDLGCILAQRLGVEVKFLGYPGAPQLTQGFANGDWRLGFAFDPQLGPQIFSYVHPYLAVENTYLVAPGSTILTVADADRPGVHISVARGNAPDVYLTAHLKNATLVRFDTVPQALAALKAGQVDAFAGSRTAEVAFLPQLPGGRILPDNFLIVNIAPVLAIGADDALQFVNRFVEQSKINFLIQLAICRAGLIGVSVPEPIRGSHDDHGKHESNRKFQIRSQEVQMKSHQFTKAVRHALLPAAVLVVTLAATAPAMGGDRDDDSRERPLRLKSQGSFFVGGETKHTDATSGTPDFPNEDDIKVNQMYVQFQIPERNADHLPVVMLNGCCLSGKTWETTPDRRMGWGEYFVRKHHAVYIPDQSSRARSGFDATTINEVKLGTQPASALPNIFTFGRKAAWELFRFGPTFPTAFSDEQFPVEAMDEFSKQVIPDLNATLPRPNPTWANLAALAVQVGGAVLMGHSESGFFPERAALTNPAGVKGLISIEPAFQCSTTLTPQQIATLAEIPTLVIFGDHLADVPSASARWLGSLQSCQQFVDQINAAGGDATMLHLPDVGLLGNSHMLMQDKNNLEVADLILKWIDQHVEGK